jgi:hypothetical protein
VFWVWLALAFAAGFIAGKIDAIRRLNRFIKNA